MNCNRCEFLGTYTTTKGEKIDRFCYATIKEQKQKGCFTPQGGPWGPAKFTQMERGEGIGGDGLRRKSNV